jgi:molecular chaperone GrpE (heat shock protein)
MGLHLSESSYICGMEWRAKQLISAQQLTPVMGGLYEGQLVVWDVADAHNDVFTRQTKFHIYGEPPVYLRHNYFAPPVGKIVHFSEREDGLYVALKLERPLEDVSGIHLSVGGFAIGEAREEGTYEIKEFAVFEASLTPTPAQPNSEIALLMKTLTDMATEKEKATLENTSGQATPKVAMSPSALGYLRKQDIAQLEALVSELAARVEALEGLSAQLADLQQRLADLEAAVSQIQGMTQEAVTQSIEKALKAVKEQLQPLTNEFAKNMLLIADALKNIKTQRI